MISSVRSPALVVERSQDVPGGVLLCVALKIASRARPYSSRCSRALMSIGDSFHRFKGSAAARRNPVPLVALIDRERPVSYPL